MATGARRHIFTAEKPERIRSALSVLLAGAESQGDVTRSGRERLRDFTRGGCDRLMLDLRGAEAPSDGNYSAVRNIRAVRLGGVLVVTGEVTDPDVFRQIEWLRHPHVPAKRLAYNFRAFVHALF
jgi:DNA-binding response OmpR family regulator